MTDDDKKRLRKKFMDLIARLPPLEPCDFCGRVFLVGWCCQEARENGGTEKRSD